MSEFKCRKCQMIFRVGMNHTDPEKPVKHCVCCGSSDLEFFKIDTLGFGPKPIVEQRDIRDVFDIGQKVLVRSGTSWHTREILAITVLRHDVNCPNCSMPLLGGPRFWFQGCGNVSLEDIMAKEDIDPEPRQRPILGKLGSPPKSEGKS